jgi:predicted nucleic acid-binding protein
LPVTSIFIDTNVFLRFLTNDDAVKASRAARLFRDAVGGLVQLRTSPLAIAEIVWTLESYYGLAKPQIAEKIEKILNTPNLVCDDSERILRALDAYVHENIDYIDAYHAFYMKDIGLRQIATCDRKHFNRIPWLEIVDL